MADKRWAASGGARREAGARQRRCQGRRLGSAGPQTPNTYMYIMGPEHHDMSIDVSACPVRGLKAQILSSETMLLILVFFFSTQEFLLSSTLPLKNPSSGAEGERLQAATRFVACQLCRRRAPPAAYKKKIHIHRGNGAAVHADKFVAHVSANSPR